MSDLEQPRRSCAATACTRPAAPGIVLCDRDANQLANMITQLGDTYAQLDATPSMQGREPDARGATLASHRTPAALAVLVLRDRRSRSRDDEDPDGNPGRGVLEVLESWARLIREQRNITRPTAALAYRRRAAPPGPVCDLDAPPCDHHTCWAWTFRTTVYPPPIVLSERRLIATHLDWCLTQDWCDELYADVKAVWTQMQAAAGHATRPGYTATCPCGGRIRWIDQAATCQSCGTTTVTANDLHTHTQGAVA